MKIYLPLLFFLSFSLSSCYTYKPLLRTPPTNQETDTGLHNEAIKVYPEWNRKATLTPSLIGTGIGSAVVISGIAILAAAPEPMDKIVHFFVGFVGGSSLIAASWGTIPNKLEENESKVVKKFKLVDKEIWVKKYNRTNEKEYVIVGEDIDEKTDKPYLILVPSIRKDRYLLEENRRRESRNGRE
ncbi:hypothetical protein P1X15_29765 [Runella sp. MFBS21]|uniref:hypothetical protein n=1 Tax=Runella sp. MFBS21 TaxID=3034018 RepID=UPI0023F711A7|nr:hypothetical protein [Runella sp. MFBS21]MDF7821840.1 hypothetical protein [Runella sp. MFBS21]